MNKQTLSLLTAALVFNINCANADDASSIEHISIIGNQQQLDTAAGSVTLIDEAELEKLEYDDIGRVLATVPGVNIRQEDGYGLRPNIGFRGVTPERSKKINIMEDGVLIGPAPYSAPAAYYFPMLSRMTAIEVTKGPSMIKYGPNTVAGALNLITRQVPTEQALGLDVAAGTDGYYKGHVYYGNASDRLGFLVEGLTVASDGFKELENGADTGFDKQDYMAKVRYDLSSEKFDQFLEVKAGLGEEQSDETYVGLTDEDFRSNPYQRYAGSQLDNMDWQHDQLQLTHYIAGSTFDLTTRVYRNNFERTWYKLNGFASSLGGQIPTLLELLTHPEDEQHQRYYEVLRGTADSTVREKLVLGNNDREFFSQGVALDGKVDVELFGFNHQLSAGIRWHEDEIQRNHTENTYLMQSGMLVQTDENTVATTTNTERTEATSLYISDTITFDKLTLGAGVRGELIKGFYQNRTPGFEQDFQDKTTRIWLPGINAYYAVDNNNGVFGGVHQGFVPTSPIQAASVEVEKSVNYELGWRYVERWQRMELVGFFNDYSNLIESCSQSAGCDTDLTFVAGHVDVYGLEGSYQHNLFLDNGWQIPLSVTYTHTQSEFKDSFYSGFEQWGYVEAGNAVPYLADNMLSVSAGVKASLFDITLIVSYADSMPESAQTMLTGNSGDSALAGKETDALLNMDVSAGYNLSDNSRIYLKVDNLLDEQDIVSRRPYGARPSKARQFQLGYKYNF
ncbi:TonB-dependent receptor family protein [Alteromonas sp. ASW11-130]|uniref:TonB-dependent receptor family protein n=1 Tax=Alteromonas sp. ASW11-130 TaxID=3015775 RepID=UPI00224245B6|nr:TonB-dependent receptor [Alteromonas sp. ASW11-130]MCW8092976.1 TonB-dependent receptor [Alteromonas sp. ASW11-130]